MSRNLGRIKQWRAEELRWKFMEFCRKIERKTLREGKLFVEITFLLSQLKLFIPRTAEEKSWVESNFSSKIKLISTYPALLALLYWHCETFSSRLFLLHFLREFETLSEKFVAANVASSSSVFLSAETFLSVDRRNSWNVKNGQRKKNANWKSDDGSRRKIKQIISTFTSVYTVECFSTKA